MKRIVIVTDNEVGVIADISRVLAENGVNIETLDAEAEGNIVVLTTDQYDKALDVLNQASFRAVAEDTLVLRLVDEPGALARVAERFKQAGVNIRSLHILSRCDGYSTVALLADDTARAQALAADELIT